MDIEDILAPVETYLRHSEALLLAINFGELLSEPPRGFEEKRRYITAVELVDLLESEIHQAQAAINALKESLPFHLSD